jgi:hypothetical protein
VRKMNSVVFGEVDDSMRIMRWESGGLLKLKSPLTIAGIVGHGVPFLVVQHAV